MSDSGLIDDIVGIRVTSEGTVQDNSDHDAELTYANDDVISDLKTTIMSIKMTMENQDKRIAQLELEIERLKMNENNERPRNVAAMPLSYATNSPMFRRRGSAQDNTDTDSFSGLSRTRSVTSTPANTNAMGSYMNRGPNAAVFSVSNPMIFKNNSATSSRGYDNELSLWGTVFASLMIACMKKYIQKTGETHHIIDETVIMKTYSRIVGDLYHRVKFADLPAVQNHEVALLSKMFSRSNKNEVPESNPKTWADLRNNADGDACMSVIESIVTAAKMVPEAMIHPISRLITAMDQPVVVEIDSNPTFAIPRDTKIEMTPTGMERFCSWLKKDSLKTYVKHRLNGDTELMAVNRMVISMRDTDLLDSQNLYKASSSGRPL